MFVLVLTSVGACCFDPHDKNTPRSKHVHLMAAKKESNGVGQEERAGDPDSLPSHTSADLTVPLAATS